MFSGRIKEEENENQTFADFGKTFRELKKNETQESENKLRLQSSNNHGKSSTALPVKANNSSSLSMKKNYNFIGGDFKTWPSSDWIKNFVANQSDESYKYEDSESYDYEEEEDDGENLGNFEKNLGSEKITQIPKSSNRSDAIDESSRLIIPNSDLPNFVYRRVPPDARNSENLAYIAVSVVAAAQNRTLEATKIENFDSRGDKVLYDSENEYGDFENLETRRRHSRRKHRM